LVPKFPPDLMHNNFISEFVSWNIATVEKSPGDWKSLEDIHTVISFGLTGQHIMRDFLLLIILHFNNGIKLNC
jgi:hypothetical protein